MAKKETAHSAFMNEYEEAASKIHVLKIRLEPKAMLESNDRLDWSYAAALAKLNGLLDQALESLGEQS